MTQPNTESAQPSQDISLDRLFSQATQLFTQNKLEDAESLFRKILDQDSNHRNALYKMGQIGMCYKDYEQAIAYFSRLQKLAPRSPQVYYNMANCYFKMRRYEDSEQSYRRALEVKPDFVDARIQYIQLMDKQNRLEEAEAEINKAMVADQQSGVFHCLLAKIRFRQGKLEEAADLFKQGMELQISNESRGILLADYCKTLEKLGRYEEAWQTNIQAQEEHREARQVIIGRINPDARPGTMKLAHECFNREVMAGWETKNFQDRKPPVFIAGFPRSGTTLLEQILSAHPDMVVTDELPVLSKLCVYMGRYLGRKMHYPTDIATVTDEEVQKLRNSYFREMEERVPEFTKDLRIVDKNPMDIIFLGGINRVFPDAAAIFLLRDPRDVILSCYFQSFAPNSDTIHFYTLEDTARFYAKTMDLWLHYRKALTMPVYELKYETLVEDLEGTARSLMEFMDEPWDENLLHYYKKENQRTIQTPSYEGVNKPIYRSSVQKWRNYEQYMEPVLPVLEPYLKTFGYSD